MSVKQARKSVLITGCSPGGIGHALAREFHAKGRPSHEILISGPSATALGRRNGTEADELSLLLLGLHVIATARTKEAIQDLEDMGMSTLALDVTSKEGIAEARVQVEKLTGGRLDVLVNNALVFLFPFLFVGGGRNCTLPATEVDLDDARACFETNFFAVIALTQTFVPLLIASKGLILNIGSVAAIVPYVFGSVYNASKAALHAYSQTLRLELEPYDVNVLVVITGGVQSRIARTDRVLVSDSLYLEIKGDFERRVKHSQDGAMGNEEYARGVVREALKGKATMKKWYWRGNKSWLVWFVSTWVGSWAFDWILPGMFGLRKLKGIVRARAR
ncbi:related to 1-acyldihydroxyacetone-phosphate reductase [Rhynchosporium agropyri]|uniref:Related to 1-acyldihydroxyacetone-phosphate reductase n=1 Tax=Rhynchosporium agropyri TaxID=914238 RepID=A0A1E1K1N6_9HELO|nr:related to 1-acyldihydroxyacetone-phosphate reductase [Rhynchosporium agropyri]